ncbi:FtsW/RodA/SpoVE family cell cycle protein [Sphaerobacter thermophilus]|uniref:Cell cycle protein n=1 Tax=Sphaerobacter thermophilus (strain ATCC 49802 / DSM 20745 / KCCM 41009 / NCIMB 13125 / S 6022) TaxID=479434 RepID=D1C6L9_SPHTD|nr:FtsW/RodA/SpoVE family cell cycle protein [Sphaerobacter thermophilus]ACZ39644.1 cell cycle protein [Sphaerobacter thermophilus DSM 20745]
MGTLITSLHARGRTTNWGAFDIYLVVTTLVLIGFGLVTIWSADGAQPLTLGNPAVRQFIYAVIGLAMMMGAAALDYRYVKTFSWVLYLGTLVILAAVLVVGTTSGGATRWFQFGPVTVQPSEIAKLTVIISLASFVADRGDEMRRLHNFILSGILVGIPAGLVYLQPDLGTTGVFAFAWLVMMLVSRTRLLYLFGVLLAAIPGAWVTWNYIMHDYMRERLLISYHPERDPLGDGYNILQARVAIGSSGAIGHGLQGSMQSQLDLLRVRLTDFIFAHAMGMFGFIGALALLLTFAILLWRMMQIGINARDSFSQLTAFGITGIVFFQMFVNIGMNVGLMPVTGIPLPFVSVGGSSLWTLLAAVGLLQSILIHQQRLGFQRE